MLSCVFTNELCLLFSDRYCGHADLAIWIATYFEIQSALGEMNPIPCDMFVKNNEGKNNVENMTLYCQKPCGNMRGIQRKNSHLYLKR